METLLLVAERNWPEMLALIAVMKALNRHQPKAGERRGKTRPRSLRSSGDRGGSDLKDDVPPVS